MPEQKDMSTPSDWSNKELVKKLGEIRDEYFIEGSIEDESVGEAMDRLESLCKEPYKK